MSKIWNVFTLFERETFMRTTTVRKDFNMAFKLKAVT